MTKFIGLNMQRFRRNSHFLTVGSPSKSAEHKASLATTTIF